jgi:hypothetical protein
MPQKYDGVGFFTEATVRGDDELSSIWIDGYECDCYSSILREFLNDDGFGGQIGVKFDKSGIVTDIESINMDHDSLKGS